MIIIIITTLILLEKIKRIKLKKTKNEEIDYEEEEKEEEKNIESKNKESNKKNTKNKNNNLNNYKTQTNKTKSQKENENEIEESIITDIKNNEEDFNYIPEKKVIKLNKNLEYECIQTIEEAHYKEITCLIYLSKKNEIVSSSLNTEIKVWGWGKKINNNFKINFNRT